MMFNQRKNDLLSFLSLVKGHHMQKGLFTILTF